MLFYEITITVITFAILHWRAHIKKWFKKYKAEIGLWCLFTAFLAVVTSLVMILLNTH